MEGPTPVSALIHAATMVAAGVYLVARMFPVFEASDDARLAVGIVGGFTALFAATMGIVMTDIKRVLAYSTISQLGYMMLALVSAQIRRCLSLGEPPSSRRCFPRRGQRQSLDQHLRYATMMAGALYARTSITFTIAALAWRASSSPASGARIAIPDA
jgi:formate hydrogenlyase subunit 3/multisubunit Na+/H+ antiporter MnhD subunit